MTGTLQTKKLPSGNSYYYIKLSYKDPRSGKWKQKTLSTGLETKNNKRKAESFITVFVEKYAWLEKLPEEYTTTINHDITLCDYLDLWLAGKIPDLRSSTYETYSYRISGIQRYFKKSNPKLIDVTSNMIDKFFKYSLRFGKINQKTKAHEPLSVRSVRSYRSILTAVFAQAVIDGLIQINPVDSVSVHGHKDKDYQEEMLFMTEEEIADLLHFLSKHYPRLVGIAFMAAYYGLRRSEILGLKWSAIDFQKNILHIQHTVTAVKKIHAEDSTKTVAGKRDLVLFETARKCLLQVRQEQEVNKAFFKNDYKNTAEYVFTWEDGTPYRPDYIYHLFSKAMKKYGRPEISLHKLRHSCASMLINKGWDIKKLQYWLGHTDAQTTLNIYSHFNRQRLNSSQNDLSEISLATADLFD